MTISLKSNPDGVSGAIQVNGTDALVFDATGMTTGIPSDQLPIGNGQSWQNVTVSRALDTIYTNTTGRTIQVVASVNSTSAASSRIEVSLNGVVFQATSNPATIGTYACTGVFTIPAGNTYEVRVIAGSPILQYWLELR